MSRQADQGVVRSARRAASLASLALGAVGFVFLVYLGLTWDLRSDDSEAETAFVATRIERGRLRETVVATGTLEPRARVVVQSEIPGIVEHVLVDDGERIGRDQPLVELDRERLEDRVAQLGATLAEREALARFDLVGRARVELEKKRVDLERGKQLFERGVLADEALLDLLHQVRLAEIALTDSRAERAARRAAVEHARNALRRAERDLEKAVIRSPVEGVVIQRAVEVGTAVADIQNGGTVVAVLADDSRIHLLAEVDENDVARVRLEQMALVRIDAFPGEELEGRVRKISSSGNSDGGISRFEIEVEIEPDPRVRVGMSADARIVVKTHEDAMLVPNTAILRTDAGPRVRRVPNRESDDFELAAIREIYSDGFRTVVGDGLSEGEWVLLRTDGAVSSR